MVIRGGVLYAEGMREALSTGQSSGELFERPPPRDRLPTIPFDLREYARIQTGPASWSAHSDAPLHDDPLRNLTTGELLDVSPSDVPCLAAARLEDFARPVDDREALILSLVDGEVTVGNILEMVGSPASEALTILCDLCARGVVMLYRSGSAHDR